MRKNKAHKKQNMSDRLDRLSERQFRLMKLLNNGLSAWCEHCKDVNKAALVKGNPYERPGVVTELICQNCQYPSAVLCWWGDE